MALSQEYGFNPNLGEATIAAFARIGVRRPEITQQHMSDAAFEANLLQSDMQGDGINLYQVVLYTLDIEPGRSAYPIDPNIVFVLDLYIRQNGGIDGIGWANDNLSYEQWDNAQGINLPWGSNPGYDPYASFIEQIVYWRNNYGQIMRWQNNSGGINNWDGVQVPQVIAPVPPPENPYPKNATDRLLIPFSRSDYAATANKQMPGFPTSYWVDYLLQPTIYLWPVPTNFAPQALRFYAQRRPMNAELADGTQIMIPYVYMDYFTWGLAERLAYIYAPDKLAIIAPRKQQAWQRAMQASTENVPINIDTQMAAYYRIG